MMRVAGLIKTASQGRATREPNKTAAVAFFF